jgi:signal transduction histidine kinase
MTVAALARRQLTAVYVPVKHDGSVKYVLAAAIEPHSWNALMKARLPSRVRALLVDAGGALVTSTSNAADDPAIDAVATASRSEARAIEQRVARLRTTGALAESSTSAFSGWSIVTYVPREAASPSADALLSVAVGALALLGLGVAAAWFIGHGITRAITDLVASVQNVASGAAPLPTRTSLLEVREASRVLTQVATQLAHALREDREVRAKLEAADRAKNDFLAMLAHELRNPLAAIRNGLEVARRTAPPEDARLERALNVVDRQSSQMVRLVGDLLDISRIEQRKLEAKLEPLDLREVVRAVAEDHSAAATVSDVVLQVDVPESAVLVRGDHNRLMQLFGNLVHNALKFTPAAGTVTMGLRTEEAWAIASVADNGAGIEADMLQAIFAPFVQATQDGARSRGGIGLGLALVKAIAELHGGSVEALSAGKGRGAQFIVRLPIGG